jgi:hypothetical protein
MGAHAPRALDERGVPSDDALLIGTGFAAGIDPRLRTGDLVLARSILHRGEELMTDDRWLDRAAEALAAAGLRSHIGRWACVEHVLSAADKDRLHDGDLLAADMESGPLARWSQARRLPFLPLRAVLDEPDQDLAFLAGRPRWPSLVRHPVASARIARRAVVAGRSIGRGIGSLLRSLTQELT